MSPTDRPDVRGSAVHQVDVKRAADRFRTTAPGLDSRHSFSFGPHYDPDNLGFGPLLVSNEDRLDPGAGYDRHAHRGVDIVTWMLAGTLEHEDSTGQRHRLSAGSAQRLRAGSGVQHAEHAAWSGETPAVHYVQMWLRSTDPDAVPDYASKDFAGRLDDRRPPALVSVARGTVPDGALPDGALPDGELPDGALTLDCPGAEFLVARLPAGAEVLIPRAPLIHVFVARGEVQLVSGDRLLAGDELSAGDRLVASDRLGPGDAARVSGARRIELASTAAAEVLVWRLPA